MIALKVAGLIINMKGKKSGYRLTHPASEITVSDIHNAFEPGICVVDCSSHNYHCEMSDTCSVHDFWGSLNNKIIDHFKSVTLQDLVVEQKAKQDKFTKHLNR